MESQVSKVSLKPPVLSKRAILKRVVCTRPMREGSFKIGRESKGTKEIIHCYGHGGAGWTTLFGSVAGAIELLHGEKAAIRVLGAGCMGLTVAVELARRGYKVAGITAKELYDLPSWGAAGYFAMVSINTSSKEQKKLDAIGAESLRVYQEIERGAHAYLARESVRSMPVYCSAATHTGLEELEALGLIPPREEVVLDFDGVQRPGFFKYMTYFMDTTRLMKQLTAEVAKLGISIEKRELHSFEEVKEEILFNCTGLGARELNGDDQLIPVRGHLLLLNERAGTGHMDYMIYTTVQQEGKEETLYLFPKNGDKEQDCFGALGGTFLDPAHCNDELEFEKLFKRHQRFFYDR